MPGEFLSCYQSTFWLLRDALPIDTEPSHWCPNCLRSQQRPIEALHCGPPIKQYPQLKYMSIQMAL